MSQFQVDSDALLGASASLRGTVSQMQSLIVTMNGQLTTLAASWSGSASLAFQDLVNEWQVTQRVVESNLDEISVALSTAHSQYSDVESANMSLFRR
jgi:early secretory antigenic target protein ESAT-6